MTTDAIRSTIEANMGDDVPPEMQVKWCEDVQSGGFWDLWRPFVMETLPGKNEYLSEDYAASARMQVAGVPQLAWTKPILKHWGDFPYQFRPGQIAPKSYRPTVESAIADTPTEIISAPKVSLVN